MEIKGRRIESIKYEDTIITASKVNEGLNKVEDGYRVFFVFVFTDKIYEMELQKDQEFKCRFTGTNCIQHYLIPIKDLKEIDKSKL